MSITHAEKATSDTKFEPANVTVRIKISGLWTAMLFIFAYVDIFSLYRPDFRADIEAGTIGGFMVNQSFLLWTTIYIVIPSLMVVGTLVLRPAINRIANLALSIIYALTIIAGAVGEWKLLHPRQRHRSRTAGGHRPQRMDLAQAGYAPAMKVVPRRKLRRLSLLMGTTVLQCRTCPRSESVL